MSYTMKTAYTLTLETQEPMTGKALKTVLIAKNVDRQQIECELEGRITSSASVLSQTLENMDASVKRHGEAFAVFYHVTEQPLVFYIQARERIG